MTYFDYLRSGQYALFDIVRDGRFIYETIPFWFDVLFLGTFLSLIFRQGARTSGIADDKTAGFWGVFLGFLASFSAVSYAYNQGSSLLLYVVGPYAWMLFCVVIGIVIWDYLDGRFGGRHRIWTILLSFALTLWLFSVLLGALGFPDLVAGPIRDILSIILWIGVLLLLFLGVPRLILWGVSSLGGGHSPTPGGPRHPAPSPSSGGSWLNPRNWFGGGGGSPPPAPGPAPRTPSGSPSPRAGRRRRWWNPRTWRGGPGGPSGGTPPEILDELEEVSEEAAREVPRVFAKLGSDFKKADKNIKYWFSTNGGARDFFKELNNQLANLSSHMSVVRKDVQTHKNLHPKLASAFGTWSAQVNEAGEASESHFDAALGSLELVKEDVDRNVSSPSHPDTVLNYVNFQTGRIADLISSLSSSSKENDVVKARLAEANEKLQKLTEPLPVLEDLSRKTESHKESLRKSSLEPERQVFSRLKEELKKSIKDCSDSLANVERNSSARVEKLLEVIDESNEKAGNCVEKIREVLKSLEDTNSFVGEIDEVIGDLSTWLGSANDIMMTFITDNDALVNELRIIEKELKEKEEEVEEKEFNFASELKSQKELLAKAVQEVEDDLFSLSDRTTNKNWADKPLERKQYEIAQVIGKLKKRTTSKSLTDSIIAVCSELENKPESPLTKQELALQKAIDNFKETFTPFEEQLLKSFDKSKKGVLAEKEDYWQTQVPQAIKTLTGELERLKKFVPVLNGAYLKLKNK